MKVSRAFRTVRSLGTAVPVSSATSLRNFNSFPLAQVTTLANNIKVVSLNNGSPLSCVGLWVKTGSRFEKPEQAGAAHFLEHMFFKGTKKRNTVGLEIEVENRGAHVNAYTSRENSAYFSDCFVGDYKHMVELLGDCIQNAQLTPERVEIERNVILQELLSIEDIPEEVTFDFLHYTAFREQSLGRPILGNRADVNNVTRDMLSDFHKTHYTGDRMVFVGVGDLDHDDLCKTVENTFTSILPTSPVPITAQPAIFTGSDYRHRIDSLEDVNFAYAFPTKGVKDPHFFTFGVIGALLGNYQFGAAHSEYAPSELISQISQGNLAKSVKSVNMAYSDVGLFGVYAVAHPYKVNSLSTVIAKEITNLIYDVDKSYFEWAKKAFLSDILSQYRTSGTADILGNDLLLHGRVIHPVEIAKRIEAITPNDVMSAAEATFYDTDFALAAFGNVWELPDYQYFRSRTYKKHF